MGWVVLTAIHEVVGLRIGQSSMFILLDDFSNAWVMLLGIGELGVNMTRIGGAKMSSCHDIKEKYVPKKSGREHAITDHGGNNIDLLVIVSEFCD